MTFIPARLTRVLRAAPLLVLPFLAACDSREERLMQVSLMGQMSALCPAASFENSYDFTERAGALGLTSDGGTYQTDAYMDAEIRYQSWIASDALGARTTFWRASYGPGDFTFRISGNSSGANAFSRPFESAEVCVGHAPHLTRSDALSLADDFGIDRTINLWRGGRNAQGNPVATAFRMILADTDSVWVEIEFDFPADPSETGVTITRRWFVRPQSDSDQGGAPPN